MYFYVVTTGWISLDQLNSIKNQSKTALFSFFFLLLSSFLMRELRSRISFSLALFFRDMLWHDGRASFYHSAPGICLLILWTKYYHVAQTLHLLLQGIFPR